MNVIHRRADDWRVDIPEADYRKLRTLNDVIGYLTDRSAMGSA
ncbi:hypothetical protein [Mycolicibacterium poriferae]|nr:hypothetical protein [Mycolicibacterium poriferae]